MVTSRAWLCDVCGYRRTFGDGAAYPLHPATHRGVSLTMEAEVAVCDEHRSWVADECPETLQRLEEGRVDRDGA